MFLDRRKQLLLKKQFGDEQVYVIPPFAFPLKVEGFVPYSLKTDKHKFIENSFRAGQYIYHYDAESTNAFYQVLFFFVIKSKKNEYLTKDYTLGFCKHITSAYADRNVKDLPKALIEEELSYPIKDTPNLIGFIRNTDGKNLGHLGYVYEVTLTTKEMTELNEQGDFINAKTLQDKYILFDNWSKSIINTMY